MTEREIADWEREIRHAQVMQEQRKSKREGWDGKKPTTETVLALKHFNKMMEQNNESSN